MDYRLYVEPPPLTGFRPRQIVMVLATLLVAVGAQIDKDCLYVKSTVVSANLSKTGIIKHNLTKIKIPRGFDARENWPNCRSLGVVFNQGQCGGISWAFASISAMSDRLCIATKGRFNQLLSTQDLLECCTDCDNKHFSAYQSLLFWQKRGLVTEDCKPLYQGTIDGRLYRTCTNRCSDGRYNLSYVEDLTFGGPVAVERSKDTKQIQAEILLNGPVLANMVIYDYFFTAQNNTVLVHNQTLAKKDADKVYTLKIIGWDVIDMVPVWTVANSRGTDWCDKGFCFIRRGFNDLNVEQLVIAGGAKGRLPTVNSGASGRVVVGGVFNVVTMLWLLLCRDC